MKTGSILLIAAFFSVGVACAKPKPKQLKLSYQLPEVLLKRPDNLLTDDQYYNQFIGKKDKDITHRFEAAWNWDEKYRPYYPFIGKSILIDRRFGMDQNDQLERKSYARDIVRQRIDVFIRAQMETWKEPKSVKIARSVSQATQNVPIFTSSKESHTGELRFGYDMLSDSSKIEYLNAPIEANLRHPELFSALIGRKPKLGLTNLGVNTNLGSDIPRVGIQLPLNLEYMDATLFKTLSPSVSMQLSKKQPLQNRNLSHDYEIRLVWNF